MAGDDDGRGAARIALIGAFVVIASFVAGKAARDAILLSNFEVTDLPMFVSIAAIGSLPVVIVVGRMLATHGPRGLVPALNGLSASLLFAEWVLYESAPRVGAVVIFFHLTLFGAVLVSGFWSIVNERFDARTARRHIGRIGVGATLGGIAGGLVAERAAVYLEPSAILLVLSGLQLICLALQIALARGAARTVPVASVETGAALKIVAKTPLLRNLAILVILGAIAATALDYVFKVGVVEATGDEGPLRFFAIYYTATNILTAIAQLLFARFLIEKLGVARSIATLPATVTVSSICALAFPGLTATVIARSSEMIVRSSVYRAAYELVYAPLAEQYKRSTKIILDVGAERIGDLLGAQLVALLVYLAMPGGAMLIGCLAAAGCALGVALLLPRSYTQALERSLEIRVPEDNVDATGWSTVGLPQLTLTDAGDLTAMSLMDLRASTMAPRVTAMHKVTAISPALRMSSARDLALERVIDLRSTDAKLVKRALDLPLTTELVPHVVALLAWDQVASDATKALRAFAPRCTGMLVDALLDATQEFAIRRRIPPILEVGDREHAIWGLRRALADSRFEVRFRCAKALASIREAGHELGIDEAEVFAAAERELSVDSSVWQNHRLLDPLPEAAEAVLLDRVKAGPSSRGLEHVFTLLALALPTGPVRIARQALGTQDRVLRGTALEYLESVLPASLRALLWPHLESSEAGEDDEPFFTLIAALEQDDTAWPRLWAAIEPLLAQLVAQPGFLDRRAPSEADRKKIVHGVMVQLRADNYRRLTKYLEVRRSDAKTRRFTSWLRMLAKRVGAAHARNREAPEVDDMPVAPRARDEIAAELMESAVLQHRPDDEP